MRPVFKWFAGWQESISPGAAMDAVAACASAHRERREQAAAHELSPWLPQNVIDYESYRAIQAMIIFDGPASTTVGDVPYVTLSQYGVKKEGDEIHPDPETRCWTEGEALFRFRRTLFSYLTANPAKQLAWRRRPRVERGPEGDYKVTCRLALLRPCDQARASTVTADETV